MNYYKIKDNGKDIFIRSRYDEETIRAIFIDGKREWDKYKKHEEEITDFKVRNFSIKDVTDKYDDIDIIDIKDTGISI